MTRQQIELESWKNPLKMGNVLQFAIKNLFQFWLSGSLFMFTWYMYVYAKPVYIPVTSSFPGSWPKEPILVSKFYVILGYNTSL